MGPCLDVYALTARRDAKTVREFVGRYVDAERIGEGRLDSVPAGHMGTEDDLPLEDWEWVDGATVGDIIEVALGPGCRAGRAALPPADPWCFAYVCFTVDERLIFGVSVEDPVDDEVIDPRVLGVAKELAESLAHLVGASRAWIALESPAPLDPERERPWDLGDWPQAIASWMPGSGWRERTAG